MWPQDKVRIALEAADGHVKPAVLIAARGLTAQAAHSALAETSGHLRPALTKTM